MVLDDRQWLCAPTLEDSGIGKWGSNKYLYLLQPLAIKVVNIHIPHGCTNISLHTTQNTFTLPTTPLTPPTYPRAPSPRSFGTSLGGQRNCVSDRKSNTAIWIPSLPHTGTRPLVKCGEVREKFPLVHGYCSGHTDTFLGLSQRSLWN